MELLQILQAFSASQWALVIVSAFPIVYFVSLLNKHGSLKGAPAFDNEGVPGLGPVRFWTDRLGYMRDAAARSKTGNWSFHAGKWSVIGLTGEAGRQAYYNAKGMSLEHGVQSLLMGALGPGHDEADVQAAGKSGWASFQKMRLLDMIKPARLRLSIPTFYDECMETYDKLPESGLFDVMDVVYELGWKLSLLALGPEELAKDSKKARTCLDGVSEIDGNYSSLDVLMPYLPTISKIKKTIAGAKFYLILDKTIKDRRAANAQGKERMNDALQLLLDYGDKDSTILKFMMGMLFTAQLNTGLNAATVMCYLGAAPVWQKRILQELEGLCKQHAADQDAPLVEQLKSIPYEVWESGMPVMYACVKDSIRLQVVGSGFRMNITSQPIPIASTAKDGSKAPQEFIPPGGIAAFSIASVLADPEVYPDPDAWNPSRYLPEDEDYAKQKFREIENADIHWGSGRHVCPGMKLAKVEMHMIIALFLARFDWHLTDGKGKKLDRGIPADWNKWISSMPKDEYRLRYATRQ